MKTTVKKIQLNPLIYGTQIIVEVGGNFEVPMDRELEIEIKPKPKKRSLNANAFYWTTMHKVIKAYDTEEAKYHNRMLIELGFPMVDEDGNEKLHWLKDNENEWMNQLPNQIHYCPTGYVQEIDGQDWQLCYELKPSHLMNSKEMARLIDCLLQDAEAVGIKIETPQEEIDRMVREWAPQKGGKND